MTSDDEEPKLSYERVLNDLANIVRTDSITSSCLHSKLFIVGTLYGRIHVFDHQGNKIDRKDLCVHLKAVNCISIDEKGEYLVSCSSERLVVYGLCDSEHNHVLMPDKPINVVAIDPDFHQAGKGRRFVVGDDQVVLYERGFLARYKSIVLQARGQKIRSLAWHGQFISWATDAAVKVYDVEQKAVITRIKRDSERQDPCRFCWKDKRTLLIGWGNTVKVCIVKERSHEVLNETQIKELPKKYVEIISMFETDFVVFGLAPFKDNLLLTLSIDNPTSNSLDISSVSTTTQDNTSIHSSMTATSSSEVSLQSNSDISSDQLKSSKVALVRPQVRVLETFSNSYCELSKDLLTPNDCLTLPQKSKPMNYTKFPYQLLSLHNEDVYFIVCPKDVISAKPRDCEDHIDWLIEHSELKECYLFTKEHANELVRHSVREIEELYMTELIEKQDFNEAAQLCTSVCGKNQEAWDDAIKKFVELDQLKAILPHLPKDIDGFHLREGSYNLVLNEFLKYDSLSFFKAIKEIPCQLYSLQTITDQVIRNLAHDPKNLVLNESLAELYTMMGKFEDAVNIYLDYNEKTRIFSLIRDNNLVTILRDRVDRLMQIDANEASQLLVENIDLIPMKDVVDRLGRYRSQKYLVSYLHRLVLKDPESCAEYHDLLVKLYAQHQQESLLLFLKSSTHYQLEAALNICKDANLIKEVVFLLGRMGDLRVALKYITESQGDINEAIEFCKEHQDPELWQDLISYSINRPEFISALLKNIGTYTSDPIELIDRIPIGCEIDGLIPALVKILQDYQLQISLERSLRDLMAKDCFSLLEKQIRCQTQGIAIKEGQLCNHCNLPLLAETFGEDINQAGAGRGAASSAAGAGTSNQQAQISGALRQQDLTNQSSKQLVVFGCHHVFHEECCADSEIIDSGTADKLLTCRVCMLEKDYEN